MKCKILLIGILIVLVVFLVPSSPAGQDEPNVAESNIVEPNRPQIEKTDPQVLIRQLKIKVDQLQKQVNVLRTDSNKNKTTIDGYNAKFPRIDDKLADLENRIRSCCASKQSSPPVKSHGQRVNP